MAEARGPARQVTGRVWGAVHDGGLPPATHALTRSVFLRALAVVYAIALLSYWVQLEGLVGSDGILPAADFFGRVYARMGPYAWGRLPAVHWLWPTDAWLHAQCALGLVAAALVVAGRVPHVALFALWGLYLSLCCAGQKFYGYQWDNLLLEVGLLAAFFAPARVRWRLGDDVAAPRVWIWLLRWLLFRLMFSSGFLKIASGDPTWASLTALEFHYWTQPIPNPLSYWAHHLPVGLHRASVVGTLAIQTVGALLIFGPRRLRWVSFVSLLGLQILITATGNFAFFNLLSMALCVLVLDDGMLREAHRWLRSRWPKLPALPAVDIRPPPRPAVIVGRAFGGALLGLTLVVFSSTLRIDHVLPDPVVATARAFSYFRSVNTYGLFVRMTTERPEIEIEGTRDGRTWEPYRFRYKAGPVDRGPPQVAPHQPRLDWQMWFAALGSARYNRWLPRFLDRLLDAEPAVLDLLERDPFDGERPLAVRAVRYDYRFTDLDERQRTGAVWTRTRGRLYLPERRR